MKKFDLRKAILENKATFHSSLTEGQFSWFTQDTDQQIGSEPENTLRAVYMFDNKGNKWLEKNYEGYGDFGGKDYYELLAQMNGMADPDRSEGISLAFSGKKGILYPALVVDPNFNYKTHDFTEEAPNDPNQSWYAPEENEDDDYVMSDRDDEYLDEVKIEEALTPLQQYVYDFESDVSGEDFAEEEKENIMNLKTVGDVKKYYTDYRGWMDDSSLREMLFNLLMDLKLEFHKLKEDFNEIEKPNTKMKVSELKAKIKEMVLSEMTIDVDDMENAPESEVDFLSEIEAMLAEADEFETAKPARIAEFLKALDLLLYDEYHAELYDSKEVKQAYDLLVKAVKKLGNLNEADEEVDAEATDTETADAELETPEGTEDVEVTDTMTTAEVDPNVKSVQDALTQAQAAAEQLGDKKLMDQIGNTITFFTRTHVVEKPGLAEGPEYVPGSNKDIDDKSASMAIGMMTKESKKSHYKGAVKDDEDHIKALKKDIKADKKKLQENKEPIFPMWNKLNK
jgi:hypothetical protein